MDVQNFTIYKNTLFLKDGIHLNTGNKHVILKYFNDICQAKGQSPRLFNSFYCVFYSTT